jgi:hypothetical protein
MKLITSIRSLMLGTATVAALSFNTANADWPGQDWKGYSAVNCVPANENSTVSISRSVSGSSVAISNTGTTPVSVFCPIVRDVSEGGTDRVNAVRILVSDRNSTAAIRCSFSSHGQNGVMVDSASDTSVGGLDTLKMDGINANNWGSYALICQIPGRDPKTNLQSYLINYRVDETLPH